MIDLSLCWAMSNVHYTDAAATKVRAMVAAIDHEIAQAPPTPALRAAWTDLVATLALGPARQTRECPACRGVGMRDASRCGNCWASLEPLPLLSDEVPQ